MTDTPDAPELDIRPRRGRGWLPGLSFVWVVPAIALLVSLGVAWQTYANRGPLIEVAFPNATGLEAGQTVLKYRDVDVGVVEDIGFSDDLGEVLVRIRVAKSIAPYVDEDAQFWIVRPEVTARGVSGLETVLSGAYIEAVWDNETGEIPDRFTGLERAPVERPGTDGIGVTLRARTGGQVAAGSPILYRGIEVGQVQSQRLSDTGDAVLIEAFIRAPHDRRITSATRFWDASGFSVSLGTQGVALDVSSLASLVRGGISFETIFSGGGPIEPGQQFELFGDETQARESVFNTRLGTDVNFSIIFSGSVSGLAAGAPVQYRGVRIGEVETLTAFLQGEGEDQRIELLANITIRPDKLGLPDASEEESVIDFLEQAVQNGMRARITTANILTGALLVELVELPDAPPATIDRDGAPYPILPSVEAEISDVSASAEGVFNRINALPVEELMESAINLLDNVNRIAADDATRATPEAVLALLEDGRALVGSEATQRVPDEVLAAVEDLRAVTADIQRIVGSDSVRETPDAALATIEEIRSLVAEIREAGTVAALRTAIDDAGAAADSVAAAADALPALVEDLRDLSAKANALALEDLVASADTLLASADRLIGTEEARAIPPTLASALEEVRALTASLRERDTAGALAAALEEADAAAAGITAAAEGVPPLLDDLRALAARADALALEDLVASADRLLTSADRLIGTDEARAIPPALTAALDEVDAVLTDLREGGATEALVSALAEAEAAATSVNAATEGLPEVVENLRALSARANELPLDELVANADSLLRSADAVLGTEDARNVPAALNDALAEVDAVLASVRESGAVDNATQALASARTAADNVAVAVEDLPALVARLEALVGQASGTLATYGDQSSFNYELTAALREIRKAADAVASLSRALERRPNSIILGR